MNLLTTSWHPVDLPLSLGDPFDVSVTKNLPL